MLALGSGALHKGAGVDGLCLPRDGRQTARNGRDVRIVYRPAKPLRRPLFQAADLAYIGWLAVGPVAAFFVPPSRYSTLSRLIARLRRREREKVASVAMRVAVIPSARANDIVLDLFASRYEAYLRLFRARMLNKHIHVTVDGSEHVEAALAEGRGAMLWIADFAEAPTASKIGFWQIGHALSHLSRPEHGFSKSRFGIAFLNRVRTRYEDRFLHERIMFDRNAPDLAHQAMLRRLRENRVVSIMAGVHEGRTLADARFLSGRLRLASGPVRIARDAGCGVLPAFTIPDGQSGRYRLVVEPPLRRPPNGDNATAESVDDYVSRLERYVVDWPAHWVGWRRSNLSAGPAEGQ